MTWTVVEPNVYLIAACLPTYRPLFVDFLGKTKLLKKTATTWDPAVLQCPSRSLGSENTEGNKKISSGFKELRESNESDGGISESSDHIRLVNISKSDIERGLGPNEIRVCQDYCVEAERR